LVQWELRRTKNPGNRTIGRLKFQGFGCASVTWNT
jgi:hypothetical protein